jgi:hypothetical protein
LIGAVFDAKAIAERRYELFGPPRISPDGVDRERYGSVQRHCGICPKPPDERCPLSCETQRKALNDGVTVA